MPLAPGNPSGDGLVRLWQEAEAGLPLIEPMQVSTDPQASAGQYIWVPDDSGTGGAAEFRFTVPVAATYVIWGRVISNSVWDDSFFVAMDDGASLLWDTQLGGTETWVWDRVANRGEADPVHFALEVGDHTLVIEQREAGTKLDKILLTNDLDFVPEGPIFTCPAGSESMVLDLNGKTATDIAGIPVGNPASPSDSYFLEGPVWANGALFMSQLRNYGELPPSNILKYTPGGAFEPFISEAGTNGLALNAAGLLVGASHKVGGIVTFDPNNAASPGTTVTSDYGGSRLNSPNDLTIRSDGTIYFTDPDWQCAGCGHQPIQGVYRVPPGGSPELLTVLQNKPNGIALSPDEKTLYVGGDSLASYPVNSDGSIGTGVAFGSGGSDGLAIDCAGNVYTTANDTVTVYSSAGASLGSIAAAGSTNVAFGGPTNTTLFITGMNPGTLRSVELNVPGYPY